MATSKQKMILDVDTGVDDATAIIMAVSRSEDVEVLAITCVAGNCSMKQASLNTLRVLKACDRLDIPVYCGADSPILGTNLQSSYHGRDGLGDIPDPDPPSIELLQKEHAVNALVRIVEEHLGEVTLVAVAPLTNLALALKLEPKLGLKLKRLAIMGGNVEGRGNITVSAEMNFGYDPEAAHAVLHQMGCQIWLVPWEICFNNVLSYEFLDELQQLLGKKAQFFCSIIDHCKKTCIERGRPGVHLCDSLAMATILDQSVATDQCEVYCSIELAGMTRGQMVIDWKGKLKKKPNVTVILGVDKLKSETMHRSMLNQ